MGEGGFGGDIPSVRGASPSVLLASNVWVLVLITEVKAEVVDDVALVFDNVGALLKVEGSSFTAEVLKCSKVVGVGGGRQAGEDTLLGKEEGTGADGEESALTSGVLLLEFCVCADEGEGLIAILDDFCGVATKDDNNVKVV